MRPDDLGHDELLELDSLKGVVRFAGQRALLLDAVAMGLMRKHLIDTFGAPAARSVLTQFGFAHGWRTAKAVDFSWRSAEERLKAGNRILALDGLFQVADDNDGKLLSKEGLHVTNSYEAEQHRLHLGRSDGPICWTIAGLLSGYVSRCLGKEVYVLEDTCTGAGHASCHLVARTREEWSAARADASASLTPAQVAAGLDVSLRQLIDALEDDDQRRREPGRARASAVRAQEPPSGLVARSPSMSALVDLAKRVAQVDSTVLITGESGAGKERVARLVHQSSPRASAPFLAVNCGAITETLLESELFGHALGAFTGARQERAGLFESANGGTLLLDEIGEVSPGMQVKLLRALQEREVRRVGENRTRKVDVRIIAATNRDLRELVSAAQFREDLFYRLKVVELRVPALRERREDILPLARTLLVDVALRMKRPTALSPAAANQLLGYPWPGNVRELENAMERAVALARGAVVELEDLPEEIRRGLPAAVPANGVVRPLEDIEREYLLAALAQNRGNQTHTAHQLKIGSATMYRKLKQYGLIVPRTPKGPPQG